MRRTKDSEIKTCKNERHKKRSLHVLFNTKVGGRHRPAVNLPKVDISCIEGVELSH